MEESVRNRGETGDRSREARLGAAFVKLADTLIADYDMVDLLNTLIQECTALVDTSAGGLMIADAGGQLQLVASTSEEADFVEVNQINAGAGPCVKCFETGKPVSMANIQEEGGEWPLFRDAAAKQGFLSMHATPLRLRGQVIGAMNLFSTKIGLLTDDDVALAQALADVATIGILQERNIRDTSIVTEQLQRALDSRILIEQAKGVIAEIASLGMDAAFGALVTHARDNGLSLRAVAEGVLDRTITIRGIRPPPRVRRLSEVARDEEP